MKLTFPHLGDAHIVGGLFFKELGIDIITPPLSTADSLEEGSLYAPEEICLPFKLMVGNLMEAYRMGADTAVMPATIGPCRLGEYGELLKTILDKNGCRYRWIILDTPSAIGVRGLIPRLKLLVKEREVSMARVAPALNRTYRLIRQVEALEKEAHRRCGYEVNQGSCKRLVQECRKKLADPDRTKSLKEALRSVATYRRELRHIPLDMEKEPLKLLLTGEIFTLIEPFANHRIEETLMDMGVCFEKRVTIGWWIRHNITNPFGLAMAERKKNAYMPHSIGGYAKETVEEGMNCAKEGYDGIIQVFPVGCMPEIVAKSVLARIGREQGISVLSVIFDEMSGEAGYITRIEAFLDMLSYSRARAGENGRKRGKKHVLFGH